MPEKEIVFLLKLLEDPDEKVFEAIKNQVMQNPNLAIEELENYWTLSENELANKRCELILQEIHFNSKLEQLSKWKNTEQNDLLSGIIIAETYFDRYENPEEIKLGIENIISRIWIEMNDQLTALEKIKLINHFLFNFETFKLLEDSQVSIQHTDLANVLNSKSYTDKSIAIIYRIIAQKLNIPLYILKFIQGNYSIMGYVDEILASSILPQNINNLVFYVLPAFRGEVWSQNQLIKLLDEKKIELGSEAFLPKSDLEVVADWIKYKMVLNSKAGETNLLLENADKFLRIIE